MHSPAAKPSFTTLSRMLCILALLATAGAMYWIATSDELDGTKRLLAGGGVLLAGLLLIAGGAHFSEGRHKR